MLVGEAPGYQEDMTGKPFTGKAGQELDSHLKRAGVERWRCHITNTVKCRPPDNHDPRPEQIQACSGFLAQEITLFKPKIIVTLGKFALEALNAPRSLELQHGIPFLRSDGIIVHPCYHPAAGLHQQNMYQLIVEDFEALERTLGGPVRPLDHSRLDNLIGRETYKEITSPDILTARLAGAKIIAVDTEAEKSGSDPSWETWSVQFSAKPGTGFLIRNTPSSKPALKRLSQILSNPGVTTLIHNAQFDIPRLESLGIRPAKILDSLILARAIQTVPGGLKALAWRLCGMEMEGYETVTAEVTVEKAVQYLESILSRTWPNPPMQMVMEPDKKSGSGIFVPRFRQPKNITARVKKILDDTDKKGADPVKRWTNISPDEGRAEVEKVLGPLHPGWLGDMYEAGPESRRAAINYACRDADATLRIHQPLLARIKSLSLEETIETDTGAQGLVLEMEKAGMGVSQKRLSSLSTRLAREREKLGLEINKLAGTYINPGSWVHVSDLVYKKLSLARPEKKKNFNSTNSRFLSRLAPQAAVVQKILDWREREKLLSAFILPLIEHSALSPDNRIHANLQTTGTLTGRMTSRNPNLLAMPVRSDNGRLIRACFRASPGSKIVHADYGKMDFCIMAHCSRDPEMTRIFRAGEDIHQQTALRIFGVKPEDQDKYKHRLPAKTVGFGVAFGLTAEGLRDLLLSQKCDPGEWSKERCQDLIREWFTVFRGVRVFFDSVIAEVRRTGYARDCFGRIRWLAGVNSPDSFCRAEAERAACNAVIQGGTAGATKRAMRDMASVVTGFRRNGWTCNPLLQIHDALMFEVSDNEASLFASRLAQTMKYSVKLRVPITVDAEIGQSWGELEKYEIPEFNIDDEEKSEYYGIPEQQAE
jgi:uracil-DNA glycosylase family 4